MNNKGLIIHCDCCGKLLNKPGALLFSPSDSHSFTRKYHIYQDCFKEIVNKFIRISDDKKDL